MAAPVISRSAPAAAPRHRIRTPPGRMVSWAILLLWVFLTLFPMWWVVRTALSASRAVFQNTTSLLPVQTTTLNFQRALGMVDTKTALQAGGSAQKINFLRYVRNSAIYSGLHLAGTITFGTMAAYAFARLRFPFRDQLFFLFISALMVPAVVLLIPNFVLVKNLGWINTFAGLVAPQFLFSPFAVFFLRQFFLGLSRDIEEAATIDGAGVFTVFWRIALPMSAPAITTLAILTFISSWNDYLWPLLTAPDEKMRVLQVGLAIFRAQTPQGAPDWTGLMAGAALAIVPTLILFLVMGRKVIDSIQFTGFK